MQIRRTALAVALAAAVTVPALSITTAAYAGDSPATHHVSRPVKIVFTATGTITAVDTAAGTVTVAAKGGTKAVRGKTVTVAVGSATRIRVGGAAKTLADLAVGYRITVVGVRQDTAYTAVVIEASAAAKHKPTPSDDATPEPSGSESRGS